MRTRLAVYAFAVSLPLSSLAAQSPISPTPTAANAAAPQKDAGVATVLGFVIPGGGQYYAEAPVKGLAITVATATAVGIGISRSHGTVYRNEMRIVPVTAANPLGIEFRNVWVKGADHRPAYAGALVGGIVWAYGIFSAPADARRANERGPRVSVTPQSIGVTVVF